MVHFPDFLCTPMVKGCVSHGFNHTTFDHVFWPAEYTSTEANTMGVSSRKVNQVSPSITACGVRVLRLIFHTKATSKTIAESPMKQQRNCPKSRKFKAVLSHMTLRHRFFLDPVSAQAVGNCLTGPSAETAQKNPMLKRVTHVQGWSKRWSLLASGRRGEFTQPFRPSLY